MKRFLSVLLTLALLMSLVTVSAVAEEPELLTIDVYDDAANYNGIQTGWFAKVIKDKFNIELNIIASQVVGNTIYATRSEEGNLGDILVVDKAKFPEIVEAGLAKDISDKLPECENIMKFKTQIDVYNKGLTGEEGKYYGIPTEMTCTRKSALRSSRPWTICWPPWKRSMRSIPPTKTAIRLIPSPCGLTGTATTTWSDRPTLCS